MEFKMDGSHKGSRRGRSRFSDFYTLNNWNRLQKWRHAINALRYDN